MAKKYLIDLGDERRARLDAFCEAAFGASAAKFVRKAIDDLIEAELENQPRLRERYEEALSKSLQRGEKKLRVVRTSPKQ